MLQWFSAAQKQDTAFISRNLNQFIRTQSPQTSRTALMHAAPSGNVQILKLLARETGICDAYNRTALMFAVSKNQEKIVPLLIAEANNVALQFGNLKRVTALQIAASKGFVRVVQMLECEAAASQWTDAHFKAFYHIKPVDAGQDSQGRTPLHYAVLNNQGICDNFYMQFSEFSPDNYGKTPLHLAVEANNLNYIQFLIDNQSHRLDVNFKSKYGINTTGLMLAVERRNLRAASLLAPLQVGQQTNFGVSALIIAVLKGFNEFISILFQSEINLKLMSNFQEFQISESVFQIAEKCGNARGLEILRGFQGNVRKDDTLDIDHRSTLGKSVNQSMRMKIGYNGILDACALQESVIDLKQELENVKTQRFRYQQLCEELRVENAENSRIVSQLKQKLLICQFPEDYTVDMCVYDIIDQNRELQMRNLALKSQLNELKQTPVEQDIELEQSQLKSQFNQQVHELTFKIQDLQEKLNVSEMNYKQISDVQTNFKVESQQAQLQKYNQIIQLFYPDNQDLESILKDAQNLKYNLGSDFKEINDFVVHQNDKIEKLEIDQNESIPQLISLLKLLDNKYSTPSEFSLTSLLETMEKQIFNILLDLKKQIGNEEKLNETMQKNESLQKKIKELNSKITEIDINYENLKTESDLQFQMLQGSQAQNKQYINQIQKNINCKEILAKVIQFVAIIVSGDIADIPQGLEDAQVDVLVILKKFISKGE